MIEFDNVKFTYDGKTYALDNITTRINKGEFICILGSNGSGKSTFAKHINALITPDEGKVAVVGYDTDDAQFTFEIRQRAGMVFQNPDDQLVAALVENDIAFGPENLGVPVKDLRIRVTDALNKVGLTGFEKRETHTLSGGQKQRVAIAGILAMQPDILILDEATAMIDPRGRKELMRICKELHSQGMTIVMITHSMTEAAEADRVLVLSNGKIVKSGTPEGILTDAKELASLNLEMPPACTLSLALQKRGIPVHTHVRIESLKEELCLLHSKA